MAVRQITARTSVVRAPAWRWGLASCRPRPFKEARTPWSRPGRFMAGQLVDLGDGAGGEAHGCDAGAITGALRQTARVGQAAVVADGSQAAAAVQQQRQADPAAPICVECGVNKVNRRRNGSWCPTCSACG